MFDLSFFKYQYNLPKHNHYVFLKNVLLNNHERA